MKQEHQELDYRKYLRAALGEKASRRPGYSMRAFAKQIQISPSHLSRVLNGEKELSPQSALKIALELNFKDEEREHFLDLVSFKNTDDHTKNILLERIKSRSANRPKKTLEMEIFRIISDWYHLPIFELVKANGFQSDANWIARKLGLSVAEVNAALDRLESVELITKKPDGTIVAAEELNIQTTDDVASTAIKRHHEQMAGKAVEALKDQAVEEREFQSVQFAFNPQNLKKAKKMIREFAEKFEADLKPQSGEEIYQLNLHFFRLTKKPKTGAKA